MLVFTFYDKPLLKKVPIVDEYSH